MSGMWMHKDEYDAMKEWENKFWQGMLWGVAPREKLEEDYVKLAWVIVNGERKMIGVHNENMSGYALHEKYPTIKIPLEPMAYDSFERWCTSFDV